MLYIYNRKSLTYEHIKIKTYILSISIVLFIGFSLALSPRVVHTIERIPIRIQEEQNKDEFHPDKLKGYIREMNFSYPDITMAQCILETGNFQSQIFIQNRNICGMKESQSRASTNKGTQLNHAIYDSWRSSLIDLALWNEAYCRNLNREQYLQLLGEVYATDKSYKEKLLKIIKDYNL